MGFAELLRDLAAGRGHSLPPPTDPEPLADLEYDDELALKRKAVELFWQRQRLPGHPEEVVAAPVPRGYRTTSKRRVSIGAKGPALTFPGAAHRGPGPSTSALDLPEHVAVYGWLARRLTRPGQRALATAANHVIVRGVPGALAVILNLRVFDGRVVRAAKQLAEDLQTERLGVRAGFLYLDPSGSDYYLEARRPAGTLSFKRLFGPGWLEVDVDGVGLRFPPTVFSQVNNAMLARFTHTAGELLGPLEHCTLLDLYCGYGLLSLTVGRTATRVLGVDVDGPAIEAARGNAAHLRVAERARFIAGRLDGEFCRNRLRVAPARTEVILLDPPRQGTAADLALALAARRPRSVVHICCGTDELPREVAAWSLAGYGVTRAVPLDMFPGTSGLETLLLLTPDRPTARWELGLLQPRIAAPSTGAVRYDRKESGG